MLSKWTSVFLYLFSSFLFSLDIYPAVELSYCIFRFFRNLHTVFHINLEKNSRHLCAYTCNNAFCFSFLFFLKDSLTVKCIWTGRRISETYSLCFYASLSGVILITWQPVHVGDPGNYLEALSDRMVLIKWSWGFSRKMAPLPGLSWDPLWIPGRIMLTREKHLGAGLVTFSLIVFHGLFCIIISHYFWFCDYMFQIVFVFLNKIIL